MRLRLPRKLKEYLARTAIVIGALVVGLLLIELGMTLAGRRKGIDYGNKDALFGDRDFRMGFRSGVHTEWGSTFRINRHGTRGPEFDRVDYLALGDSCTFMGPLKEEETYPFLLSSPTVQAVNAG